MSIHLEISPPTSIGRHIADFAYPGRKLAIEIDGIQHQVRRTADEARSKARDNVPGWDRFDPFENWHFLNVPRTTRSVEQSHCHDNCVLTGIAHHAEALTTASTDRDRAEALFFLGHWIGDVHQPLHISYVDDRGGNDIKPINGGFYASSNLHAVWDSGIIAKAIGSDG